MAVSSQRCATKKPTTTAVGPGSKPVTWVTEGLGYTGPCVVDAGPAREELDRGMRWRDAE